MSYLPQVSKQHLPATVFLSDIAESTTQGMLTARKIITRKISMVMDP
jgi:hypothetical protein